MEKTCENCKWWGWPGTETDEDGFRICWGASSFAYVRSPFVDAEMKTHFRFGCVLFEARTSSQEPAR